MRERAFLDVAGYVEDLEIEASLRTQIGRLYYSAYFEARTWCEQNLDYTRTRFAREHAEVARLLTELDSDLADNLAFLRVFRNAADYDMEMPAETVLLQLGESRRRAANVIARLDSLGPNNAES